MHNAIEKYSGHLLYHLGKILGKIKETFERLKNNCLSDFSLHELLQYMNYNNTQNTSFRKTQLESEAESLSRIN
jgi:hypothetical protein